MADVKILLVKDESLESMDIKQTLESIGYDVPYIASNSEEAIEKASTIHPDLILMDIVSKEDANGVANASSIKELNIPIIYLIAQSEKPASERTKLTEPHGYIIKSCEPIEIKYAIELVLYKNQMAKQLKEIEKKFYMLFKNNPLPYQSLDENGNFLDVNPAWLESLGYSKDEVIGKNFAEFLTPEFVEIFKKNFPLFKSAGEIHGVEFEMKHKNGSNIFVSYEGKIGYDELGHFKQTHCIFKDISETKAAKERINKLYRLYITLSQINQSIVRIKTREELFQAICHLCVKYGKFRMAWIGLIDQKTGKIKPVASSGYENDYLKKISLNIQENPYLHETSIMAINKGEFAVTEDIKKDKNLKWRDEALKRNYRSFVSIPFFLKGELIGILNIYSSKPHFFKDEEIDLVKEIGLDISFALDSIKTENDLKTSERNYRDLVNNSLVGVYKTNIEGDILFANKSMAKIFQYDTVEELKKENIKNLYKNSEDRYQLIHKIEKEGQITDYESEIVGKYGHTANVLISANLKENILSGMFMDITDRKRSEEKFKTLINNSTDLIRILDKNGLIIFNSPSSTRILGYPEEYFINKNPLDFIHPDDLDRVKKDLNEVYENINSGTPTEFRIRKADGTYIFVESVSQNMFKIPYINGVVVTTHPIQQRKEMENKLQESEKKYRTLFEEDPDYTILLKPDGTILDANNATTEIAGLSPKELIGENFTELKIIPPEDLKCHLDRISSLLKGEDIEPFESRFIDKYGGIHWVLVRFKAVKENKDVNYILGIATDITDYKIAANEIKSSLREKNILIQEIHHRVKNNMQIISSLLNLQKQYVDEKEAVNVLMESQNRVKSMSLIHEKLYLSKDFTRINFAEYIESLVMNLFYTYNVRENIINPILEIDDVNLNMETAVPCGLIISETVSNSLKYAFPNEMTGEIYISLKSVEDKYELIIRDNGIGLPDELDFNNLDSLGLLLVYNLTDQIDGELKINNNPGTEFKITFKELEYKNRI